jgi:mannitol-1-phosphate/altronate dehydrogenase
MTPVSPDIYLQPAHLARLPAEVGRPAYLNPGAEARHAADLDQLVAHARPHDYQTASLPPGILHFGPGAFHRVHQAWFVDKLLADDARWSISGVSLRSPEVRDALAPQAGLYTLAILDEHTSYQVVGSLREILVAPENPETVLARLSVPTTRVVTITVTEKG